MTLIEKKEIAKINQMPGPMMAEMFHTARPGHPYFRHGSLYCKAFKARLIKLGGPYIELSKKLG